MRQRILIEQFDKGRCQGTVNDRGIVTRMTSMRTYYGPRIVGGMCPSEKIVRITCRVAVVAGDTYRLDLCSVDEKARWGVEHTITLHGDVDLTGVALEPLT